MSQQFENLQLALYSIFVCMEHWTAPDWTLATGGPRETGTRHKPTKNSRSTGYSLPLGFYYIYFCFCGSFDRTDSGGCLVGKMMRWVRPTSSTSVGKLVYQLSMPPWELSKIAPVHFLQNPAEYTWMVRIWELTTRMTRHGKYRDRRQSQRSEPTKIGWTRFSEVSTVEFTTLDKHIENTWEYRVPQCRGLVLSIRAFLSEVFINRNLL